MRLFIQVLFFVFSHCSFGQSLNLFDMSGLDVSEDTIFVYINSEDYDIQVPVGIENASSSALDINVTRLEVDVLANTSSYFCWGVCTGVLISGQQTELTPSGHVPMASGQLIPGDGNGFVLHYDPNNQIGTSLFKVRFFDISNPSDHRSVYISITSTSTADLMALQPTKTPYPNPVNTILHLDNAHDIYYLYTADGRLIATYQHTFIDFSQMESGIYWLKSARGAYRIVKE